MECRGEIIACLYAYVYCQERVSRKMKTETRQRGKASWLVQCRRVAEKR